MYTSRSIRNLILTLIISLDVVMMPAYGEETTIYKIELILFSHRIESATQSIYSPDITAWPDIENAVELASGEPDMDPSGGLFEVLPISETNLAEELSSLAHSKHYEVIKHLIWQQPGLDQTSARSIRIHGGEDYKDQYPDRLQTSWSLDENEQLVQSSAPMRLEQLDGTVKVVLGRYLHVYTDLILRQPIMEKIEYSDGRVEHSDTLADFRIRIHRRMRSQELHYLDHPLLGILVEITPILESKN